MAGVAGRPIALWHTKNKKPLDLSRPIGRSSVGRGFEPRPPHLRGSESAHGAERSCARECDGLELLDHVNAEAACAR